MVSAIIKPTEDRREYPLIIGEHGTGKTSLIKLALNNLPEPEGVVYVDISRVATPVPVAEKMLRALGCTPDSVLDSKEGSRSDFL